MSELFYSASPFTPYLIQNIYKTHYLHYHTGKEINKSKHENIVVFGDTCWHLVRSEPCGEMTWTCVRIEKYDIALNLCCGKA